MPLKVVIVGCGYIGSALGQALVLCGHDVVGTTTTPARAEALRQLGIEPVVLTVADTAALRRTVADREVAYLTVAAGRDADYRAVYLAAVENLLSAVRGSALRRVTYTSSTSVYGQDDGGWVDEASPAEPSSTNGLVLLETEQRLLSGAQDAGITATVVRLSGIYGPDRDPAERIARLAGQQLGGGKAYLNLIHRDDVVSALTALLDVPYHGVLNLSDDHPTPRREYYDRIIAARGLPAIQWSGDTGLGSRRGKRVRNERIKQLLGLRLKHPSH